MNIELFCGLFLYMGVAAYILCRAVPRNIRGCLGLLVVVACALLWPIATLLPSRLLFRPSQSTLETEALDPARSFKSARDED